MRAHSDTASTRSSLDSFCSVDSLDDLEQVLGVPKAVPLRHHVRPTDSVVGLAVYYGVSPVTLRRQNRLFHDRELFIHKSIIIPGHYEPVCPSYDDPKDLDQVRRLVRRLQRNTACQDLEKLVKMLRQAQWSVDRATLLWDDRQYGF